MSMTVKAHILRDYRTDDAPQTDQFGEEGVD